MHIHSIAKTQSFIFCYVTAVVFGDPHFVTFDGVEYSFNGKGEWTLMRSTTGAQNRFLLQGRTEQMPDWEGEKTAFEIGWVTLRSY